MAQDFTNFTSNIPTPSINRTRRRRSGYGQSLGLGKLFNRLTDTSGNPAGLPGTQGQSSPSAVGDLQTQNVRGFTLPSAGIFTGQTNQQTTPQANTQPANNQFFTGGALTSLAQTGRLGQLPQTNTPNQQTSGQQSVSQQGAQTQPLQNPTSAPVPSSAQQVRTLEGQQLPATNVPRTPSGLTLEEALAVQQENRPSIDVTPEIPEQIDSSTVSRGITQDDIQQFISSQLSLQQQASNLLQPTQNIQALRQQANDLTNQLNQLNLAETQGILGTEGQGRGITLEAVSGQQQQISREAAIQRQALTNQLEGITNQLEVEVDNQAQQLDAVTKQMQFNQQNVSMLQTLSELTTPDVLSTQIDGRTGEVFAFVQDPQTGQVTQQTIGAVTPEKAAGFSPNGTFTNSQGQIVAWGVNDNTGAIETHAIGQTQPEQDTQIINVGGQQTLVDRQTGDILRVLGPAGSPGGEDITGSQRLAAGFAQRITNANQVIEEVGEQFTGTGSIGGFLPSFLQTEDRQVFEQAKRNYINAVLRRESGAAIAPSEFENAEQQYFPKAGDSEAVLQQKAQNRRTVQLALELESGAAIDQLREATGQDTVEVVNIQGQEVMVGSIVENAQGQRGLVNPDGSITIVQ